MERTPARSSRRRQLAVLASGIALVAVGLIAAYWWFYKLGPSRCVLDPTWRDLHSESEYWGQVQAAIHRGMWSHDDGFTVGLYGDKAWAQWIMAHVSAGKGMGCLGGGPCHSDYAMRLITNQDFGDSADRWLAWWKKNSGKSQEAWIADGFAKHGVNVTVRRTAEQTETLLALLGNPQKKQPTSIPGHLDYNAFRWLRDSGFEPVSFQLSKRPLSADVSRGLLTYADFNSRWPSALHLGRLSFATRSQDPADGPVPQFLKAEYQTAAHALIVLPFLLGTAIIASSLRQLRRRISRA